MKSNFSYKDIYVEDGKKVLEMNILPEKYSLTKIIENNKFLNFIDKLGR